MQKKKLIGLLGILLIITLPNFLILAYAETIVFKSGKSIEGKILEKTDKYIKIDFNGVNLTYFFDEIESIDGMSISQAASPNNALAIKRDFNGIKKEIKLAVVSIGNETLTGEQINSTGFIISSSGLILTTYHSVDSAKEIKIKLNDGTIYLVIYVIAYDIDRDWCLLKVDAERLPALVLGESNNLKKGDKVYLSGYAFGQQDEISFSEGIFSGTMYFDGYEWLQITGYGFPGESGGPLIDSQLKVVGIITRGEIAKGAIGTPINEIKPLLNSKSKINLEEFGMVASQKAFLIRGDRAFLKKDFDTAILYYTQEVKIHPKKATAYNSRGLAYKNKGDYAKAFDDFNKAIEIEPSFAQAYFNRGIICAIRRDFDSAISDNTKAIQSDSNYSKAYSNRAGAYFYKKEYDKSWDDLYKAEELGEVIDPVFLRMLEQASGKKYRHEIDKDNFSIYFLRGIDYSLKNKFNDALSYLNKAIEINPDSGEAYNARGMVYKKMGNLEQSILDFTRAIDIKPNPDIKYSPAFFYYNRASIYMMKGDIDKATSDYSKAIETDPLFVYSYYDRANIFVMRGNFDQAILDLTKAIELEPNDAAAYANRAVAYFGKHDYKKSWEDIHAAEKIDSSKINPKFLEELKRTSGEGQ